VVAKTVARFEDIVYKETAMTFESKMKAIRAGRTGPGQETEKGKGPPET
jgi:hypothetical protein